MKFYIMSRNLWIKISYILFNATMITFLCMISVSEFQGINLQKNNFDTKSEAISENMLYIEAPFTRTDFTYSNALEFNKNLDYLTHTQEQIDSLLSLGEDVKVIFSKDLSYFNSYRAYEYKEINNIEFLTFSLPKSVINNYNIVEYISKDININDIPDDYSNEIMISSNLCREECIEQGTYNINDKEYDVINIIESTNDFVITGYDNSNTNIDIIEEDYMINYEAYNSYENYVEGGYSSIFMSYSDNIKEDLKKVLDTEFYESPIYSLDPLFRISFYETYYTRVVLKFIKNLALLILINLLMYVFLLKVTKNENKILSHYNYSNDEIFKLSLIEIAVIYIIIFIISLIFSLLLYYSFYNVIFLFLQLISCILTFIASFIILKIVYTGRKY